MSMPRAPSRRTLAGTASAAEKSIATSASGHSPATLSMSIRPATCMPNSALDASTILPIRPYPMISRRMFVIHSCNPTKDGCKTAGSG